MIERDPIVDALASLETPPLDHRFAARVGAHAKAELELHARRTSRAPRLFWVVRSGLVPALLTLAALVQTAETFGTAAKIYAKADTARTR